MLNGERALGSEGIVTVSHKFYRGNWCQRSSLMTVACVKSVISVTMNIC